MKIKKSRLKELVKQSIIDFLSEDGREEKEAPPEGGEKQSPPEKEEKPMTNIEDNPFGDDIKEIDFKSQDAFQKYNSKHKMRKSTKVNIGGKETTAGDAEKKTKKKKEKDFDVGGPAYPNVPKGAKTSKQAKAMKQMDSIAKNIGSANNTKDLVMGASADEIGEFMDEIPDIGQNFKEANWYNDNIRDHEMGVNTQDDDVIQSYRERLFKSLTTPKKESTKSPKSTEKKKTKKSEKEVSKIEKNMMNAADAANAKMDAAEWLGDKKNIDSFNKMAADGEPVQFDTDSGQSLTWEDGEAGMFNSVIATDQDGKEVEVRFDDIVRFNKPPTKPLTPAEELKKWKETDKKAMDKYGNYLNKDAGLSDKFKKNPAAMKRLARDLMNKGYVIPGTPEYKKQGKKLAKKAGMARKKGIHIGESKKRRFTVKEVRTWMKTLEENRYKKTYNSDCRRVAWMVNNEGVDLSEMPKSMAKKWSKAQYGRERYLAMEFLKSKKEQMAENKLRSLIRKVIINEIRG